MVSGIEFKVGRFPSSSPLIFEVEIVMVKHAKVKHDKVPVPGAVATAVNIPPLIRRMMAQPSVHATHAPTAMLSGESDPQTSTDGNIQKEAKKIKGIERVVVSFIPFSTKVSKKLSPIRNVDPVKPNRIKIATAGDVATLFITPETPTTVTSDITTAVSTADRQPSAGKSKNKTPVKMEKPSGNPLEQFVILSKSAKGAAAVELIKQVLEAPGVYVFGELMDMPNIKELKSGPYANYYNLLNLFAYGSCREYKENKDTLPALTPIQFNKLRHLTIVSLATKNKCLPYTLLLKELEVSNLRELEDLIIEVIYADIIRGKLDQKHQQLEVDYAIGRDIKPEDIGDIIAVLQDWCLGSEALLVNIEQQVMKLNDQKNDHAKHLQMIEQQVANIKKTLSFSSAGYGGTDEHIDLPSTTDSPDGQESPK